MDAENACNGRKANGSHLDNRRVNEFQSTCSIRYVHDLITYLANTKEATSREIETGTNLRQPEVSIAMRTLRQNNWIDEREVKAEGKGRPMKIYKLRVPIEKIIQHCEEEKNSEVARTMQAIQRLKELSSA
jgi:predicted transcriptional regulator